MTDRTFRLDKRSAKILGVCAGISNFTGVDVLWVRAAAVLATLLGSGFPALAYIVIALLAESEGQPLVD